MELSTCKVPPLGRLEYVQSAPLGRLEYVQSAPPYK